MDTSGNRAWKVETNGVNVVPDGEKTARLRDLFWLWFGANIGILGILYGVIIMGFHLGFLQAILAAGIGSLSFVLVGVLSVAGRDGGLPMFVLSRTVFGFIGNRAPALVNWLNLLGWESVMAITGALSLQALFDILPGVKATAGSLITGAVVFIFLVAVFSLFGYATLVFVQKIAVWVFGGLTLWVILLLLRHTTWQGLMLAPSGSWFRGFLPAVSIIIAGTGISWSVAAADYSRYVSRQSSTRSLILAVALGGAIPLFVLMLTGILVASRMPDLASAANPIAVIGSALPGWMTIPYLIAVVGGLIAEANLSLYSSGLNLMAMGVRLPRQKTIWFDAVITLLTAGYVLFFRPDFIASFEAFLTLIGVGLAAWAGVFLADWWWLRRHSGYGAENLSQTRLHPQTAQFNWFVLLSWGVGIGVGLLLTATSLYTGPLAKGVFAVSNLGVIVAFLLSGLLNSAALILRRREVSRSGSSYHSPS